MIDAAAVAVAAVDLPAAESDGATLEYRYIPGLHEIIDTYIPVMFFFFKGEICCTMVVHYNTDACEAGT